MSLPDVAAPPPRSNRRQFNREAGNSWLDNKPAAFTTAEDGTVNYKVDHSVWTDRAERKMSRHNRKAPSIAWENVSFTPLAECQWCEHFNPVYYNQNGACADCIAKWHTLSTIALRWYEEFHFFRGWFARGNGWYLLNPRLFRNFWRGDDDTAEEDKRHNSPAVVAQHARFLKGEKPSWNIIEMEMHQRGISTTSSHSAFTAQDMKRAGKPLTEKNLPEDVVSLWNEIQHYKETGELVEPEEITTVDAQFTANAGAN